MVLWNQCNEYQRSHTCGAEASYPQRVEDGIGGSERRLQWITSSKLSFTIPLLILNPPYPSTSVSMEAFSVQSLTLTTIPSSLSHRGATEKPCAHVNLSHFTRYPSSTRSTKHGIRCRTQASGDKCCSFSLTEHVS